jgi:hypothetical protein
MKLLLRAFALLALIGLVVAAIAVVAIKRNPDRILKFVLDRVQAASGVEIVPSGGHIDIRRHLVVVLNNPRVIAGGHEAARAKRVEAVVSYHSLVFDNGLPLFLLTIRDPQLKLAAEPLGGMPPMPRLDASTTVAISDALVRLSAITRRIDVLNGSIVDDRGAPLVSHLDLRADRRKRLAQSPWRVRFGLTWNGDRFPGSQFSGDLRFGKVAGEIPPAVVEGKLWGWGLSLERTSVGGIPLGGTVHTELSVALGAAGELDGSISAGVQGLVLRNEVPVALGDYSVYAHLGATAQRAELENVTLRQGSALMLTGQCHMDQPYEAAAVVSASCTGLRADLTPLKRLLKSSGVSLPAWLSAGLEQVKSGLVQLDRLAFDSSLADLKPERATLMSGLSLDARVSGVDVAPPGGIRLPDLRDIGGQIRYARGILTVSQGGLRAGKSTVSDFQARVDLANSVYEAPYEISLRGDADLDDLYPWVVRLAARAGADPSRLVEILRGQAGFDLRTSGRLAELENGPPRDYQGQVSPRGIEVKLKDIPGPVTVDGGTVSIRPGRLSLNHLRVNGKPGFAFLDGEISIRGKRVATRALTVELSKVPADKWLPVAISPSQLTPRGLVDGKTVIGLSIGDQIEYSAEGTLRMGPGDMIFGFIRSPMLVPFATVSFKGHNCVLELPEAKLEGQTVNLKVFVTDLVNPILRIEAVAQRLDLKAIKLVRLPWEPKSPEKFLGGINATGHIEAREGNLEAMPLSALKTDFVKKGGDWRVYDLHANSLGGGIDLELTGTADSDWINMKGRAAGIDADELFIILGSSPPPMVGKLYADFDLWGDTDTDFFRTLAGKVTIALKEGRLQRFTLLSRLLGLIDVKNWLTANVPDPRETGLPFRLISASFAGKSGAFQTENFLLDGPVMDITGEGVIDVGQGTLDMELGALPFQTVSWLIDKIPLIGKGLTQNSGGIVAAYFQVKGPVKDPRVTPEPITSAAEIFKKTLGLPINLLRPNTIR